MESKYLKFENPERVAELNPAETLKKIGLKDGQILSDIGAGKSEFSLLLLQGL